jgi:hypothetical protein
MEQAIGNFCDWLGATPISLFFQTVTWIIPMTQSVHIAAIAVVMSSALMVDMKLLGVVGRGVTIGSMNHRFLPWIWTAVLVLLLSGSILIIAEPRRDLMNNVFRLKMLLLIAALAVTLGFQETVRRNASAWGVAPARPWSARAIAVVSLAIWIAIVMCGRWIAYVDHG